MEPYSGGACSTGLGLAVNLVVLGAIVAGCCLAVLEWLRPELATALQPVELAITGLFVVEYLLRWYSAPSRWRYPFTILAALDLAAIVPGLLTLRPDTMMLRAVRGTRLLRLLRLVRLLRLLRWGPMIYQGLVHARVRFSSLSYRYRLRELSRLLVWAVVALVTGANLVHLTEISLAGREGPYATYWGSYWSILVVLLSGIQDNVPLSILGRAEVSVLLIVGVVIVAMLTGELVSMLIRGMQRAGKVALKPPWGRFERHVVILGLNERVGGLVRQLHAALRGLHHVVIVAPDALELPVADREAYRNVFAVAGDPTSSRVLEDADLDSAARVVVLAPAGDGARAGSPDSRALMATVAVLCRRRPVPLVVELTDQASLRYTAGLTEADVVVGSGYSECMLAQAVLSPGVTEIYDHLLGFSDDSNELFAVPVPDHLVGRSFAEAQLELLDDDREAVTLLGVDRSPEGRPRSSFSLSPAAPESGLSSEELTLRSGDRLVVMAYCRPTAPDAEPVDRWATTWLARRGS